MTTTSLPAAGAPASASARTPRRSRAAHSAGFWTAALAFAIAMAFSTIPTPIYALYQQRDGFSPIVVTVIFAAYAVGVAVSLYLVGHVSDWWGRRVVFIAALAVEIVAAVMFLLWQDVTGLIVARFVSGVGIGGLTATATAHIAELRAVAVPSSTTAPVVSNFANIGGLAVGPLVAGALITWVPAPLDTPYAVFLVLLVLALVATALIPETVDRGRSPRPCWPRPLVSRRASPPGRCRSPCSCRRPSRRCSPCVSACVVSCCCRGSSWVPGSRSSRSPSRSAPWPRS